jgi:hypothetical protein
MMAKKINKETSVAYFDNKDQVSDPGFYIVEKEAADNDGKIAIGDQVYPHPEKDGWFDEPHQEGGE